MPHFILDLMSDTYCSVTSSLVVSTLHIGQSPYTTVSPPEVSDRITHVHSPLQLCRLWDLVGEQLVSTQHIKEDVVLFLGAPQSC